MAILNTGASTRTAVAQVCAFENPRKKSLGNESIRCLPSFAGQLKRLLEMYGKTPYIVSPSAEAM
jgi:hypothetical protein